MLFGNASPTTGENVKPDYGRGERLRKEALMEEPTKWLKCIAVGEQVVLRDENTKETL